MAGAKQSDLRRIRAQLSSEAIADGCASEEYSSAGCTGGIRASVGEPAVTRLDQEERADIDGIVAMRGVLELLKRRPADSARAKRPPPDALILKYGIWAWSRTPGAGVMRPT